MKVLPSTVGASRFSTLPCVVRVLAFALCVGAAMATTPACAQQRGNPFAGRSAGGAGPYGSDAGARVHMMQQSQIMTRAYGAAAAGAGDPASVVVEDGGTLKAPRRVDPDSDLGQVLFASCAGGAFLGGLTSATTTTVVASGAGAAAAAGMGLPILAGAVASASAIGCGIGVATAVVSLGAADVWRRLFHIEREP